MLLVFLMWCFNKSRLPKEIVLGKIIQYPKVIRVIHYRGVEPSQDCLVGETTVKSRIPHSLEDSLTVKMRRRGLITN